MFQLKYPINTSAIKEMEDRLDDLSVAYKSIVDKNLKTPVLSEGQTVVNGLENIKSYIDQLEIEIRTSRNFAC